MPTDAAFLGEIKLFADLDVDERTVLGQACNNRSAVEHETLFRAGEPGDSMFIVQSGSIELFVKDTAGQKIVLRVAKAGDYFGELSLLDGGSRTATAVALEPSELVVLDREDLLQLFKTKPHAALDMLATMGGMTRKANAMLRERVVRNVNEEVADNRSLVDRVADRVAQFSGEIKFIVIHVVIFTVWIGLNVTGLARFDSNGFPLLTMIVSLEAIFLSCLVLISANLQAAKDRVRADIEYEVNIKAELEIAHLHEKTDRIHEDLLERFTRLEKALAKSGTTPGSSLTNLPRSG